MNSVDSSNMAGMPAFIEDKSRVTTSNIDLTGCAEILTETEGIYPNLENEEFVNKALPRKNMLRTSYSQLESKVNSLENHMGGLLKSEAQLKGEIAKMKIERDGYKKLLEDNEYFTELQNTISNISSAILTNNSIGEIKFNHQIMLKDLINDDMKQRILDE